MSKSATIRTILVGSGNPHKLDEIRRILAELPVELLGLDQVPSAPDVVEDGVTFVGKSEVNPSGPPASRQGAPADAKAQKPDAAGTTGKVDTSENAEEGKGKSGVFGRK